MRRNPRRPGMRAALDAAAIPTFSGPRPMAATAGLIRFLLAPGWLPRGRRVYAIGDIHGCLNKLIALHALIAADFAARPTGSAVLIHLGDYIDQGPDSAGVVALLSAALVLVASYNQDYLMRDGPIKRALLWIGSRSYTLYLIHAPSYFLTREIWYRIEPAGTNFGGNFTLRFVLTALVLLVLLTELNYRLVETPLRIKGARIADRLALRVPRLHRPEGGHERADPLTAPTR